LPFFRLQKDGPRSAARTIRLTAVITFPGMLPPAAALPQFQRPAINRFSFTSGPGQNHPSKLTNASENCCVFSKAAHLEGYPASSSRYCFGADQVQTLLSVGTIKGTGKNICCNLSTAGRQVNSSPAGRARSKSRLPMAKEYGTGTLVDVGAPRTAWETRSKSIELHFLRP